MTSKYLEIANGEYINPVHIVSLKLIRDTHEPKTDIVEIEFQLATGKPITMKVADMEKTKEKLRLSDIVF